MVAETVFQQRLEDFMREQFKEISRLKAADMDSLELLPLLRQINPYHCRARGISSVCDFIKELVDGEESKFELYLFHGFMRSLAFMVAQERFGACKSESPGIDFELEREGVRYLVRVGTDESSQDDIRYPEWLASPNTGVEGERPKRGEPHRRPTLGIYFGGSASYHDEFIQVVKGKAFWELVSGESDFYEEVSHLIGRCQDDLRGHFIDAGARALNRLSRDFFKRFCSADGSIDWQKIVTLVSKSS